MANLPTRSWQAIVSTTIAGIQGRASSLIDFGQGSPLRAIVEGFAGAFLWLQAIALQILTSTRLSTSSGNDVDTFVGDFMPTPIGSTSPRLGAQASAGLLTFSRYTAGAATRFIPVGATVQTSDGSQNFVVIASSANVNFSSAMNGYVLAAAVASIVVPAQAFIPGAGGNVAAGVISVMTSPITGIDTVANAAAFTSGQDQETDAQLKARFSAYILSLSRGDYYGTALAIKSLGVGAQFALVENYNLDGSWHPGFYYVVVDDGSGYPSNAFIAQVTAAVQAVRPLGNQAAVFSPTVVPATVSMTITTTPGYDHNTVVAQVAAFLTQSVNGLGLGVGLPYSILSSWAYSQAGVSKVAAVLLNGQSGDSASLMATPTATIKIAGVIVS
jgi:hypothetical protein